MIDLIINLTQTIPLKYRKEQMVRITKVTTKKGDFGKTQIAGKKNVSKSCSRIAALGSIDELNTILGLIPHLLKTQPFKSLRNQILRIQNELFNLGAMISVLKKDRRKDTPQITQLDIERLEAELNSANSQLKPLNSFVIPGGNEINARLHVARTVCRRAELELATLYKSSTSKKLELIYLNRLSDWLFVQARLVSLLQKQDEILWQPSNK